MLSHERILITGGAGFIGSELVRQFINETGASVINVDKLTYAGNLESLAAVEGNPRYHFQQADICAQEAMAGLFDEYRPDAVMHLAAESHVDRSIEGPEAFVQTNVVGTCTLLQAVYHHWRGLSKREKADFRFLHVSTNEVYGSLAGTGLFTETAAYAPNSPYSASKAASDHFVRAWHRTYGLPVLTTNCSNNYGPYQFPEKLIPLMILNALEGRPLPIYGRGENVRDWLYVADHARALRLVLREGSPGEAYNIGGFTEKTNLEVATAVCALLDEAVPEHPVGIDRYEQLITYVADRPGHDLRYAIDATKIQRTLGWRPQENFATGLRKTVDWYLDNPEWCRRVQDGSYRRERLGLPHDAESEL